MTQNKLFFCIVLKIKATYTINFFITCYYHRIGLKILFNNCILFDPNIIHFIKNLNTIFFKVVCFVENMTPSSFSTTTLERIIVIIYMGLLF